MTMVPATFECAKWPRMALRGLTYLVTEKGPQGQRLKEMGKAEDPSCVCGGRRRMRHNCLHARGSVMEGGDPGKWEVKMRSGARRWRGFCSEGRGGRFLLF